MRLNIKKIKEFEISNANNEITLNTLRIMIDNAICSDKSFTNITTPNSKSISIETLRKLGILEDDDITPSQKKPNNTVALNS